MPTCVARRRLAPSGITCVSAFYPGRGIPISWPVISTTTRIPPPCAVSCKSMTSLLRKWFLASIPTDIFGPITMPSKIAIPVWIIFWPHPAFSRDWCRKRCNRRPTFFPLGIRSPDDLRRFRILVAKTKALLKPFSLALPKFLFLDQVGNAFG